MRKSFFLLALLVFFSFSCVEENNPGTQDGTTVNEKITLLSSEIVLSEKEQIAVLEFESSVAWTIEPINDRASEWCSVEPSSGDAGKASVVVSVNENLDYDDRQAVWFIKAGKCSEKVVVSQKQKDALTVTSSRFEISSDGGIVDVEVKSNVDFEYHITESADAWLHDVQTKALESHHLTFNVDENYSTTPRSASIYIISSNFMETISVYQDGTTPMIVISDKEYYIGHEGGTVSVDVSSNVNVSLEIPPEADWVSEDLSRSTSTNTYRFDVSPNTSYDSRTVEICFTSKEDNLCETIKIIQAEEGVIFLSKDYYEFPCEGGMLGIDVQFTRAFDVEIDCDWIREGVTTKALQTQHLSFEITPNTTPRDREGCLNLIAKDEDITQTIRVKQSAGNPLVGLECAPNEILYTTKYDLPVELGNTKGFGGNLVYNTYENGVGRIVFGNDITTIPTDAFRACNSLKTIKLPDTIKSIEAYAFAYCTSLESFVVPENALAIRNNAFQSCAGLKEIVLNDVISHIGSRAFSGCNSLRYIYFPGHGIGYGDELFYGCTGELIIDGWIPSGKFRGSRFSRLVINEGVTLINPETFKDCTEIECFVIPQTITTFGECAFLNCTGEILINCDIPSAETHTKGAFYKAAFSSVKIGQDVKKIGSYAFYDCSNMVKIEIPDNVSFIGDSAFWGCTALKSIHLPSSLQTVEWFCFRGCTSLESIDLPENLRSIQNSAFSHCKKLQTIRIPDNVTEIAEGTFSACDELSAFTGKYASDDGRCLIVDGNLIAIAPYGLSRITLPDNLTKIGSYVFYENNNIQEVVLGNNVSSISQHAFTSSKITEIVLPDSVKDIGFRCFYECRKLKKIIIGNGISHIAEDAFDNCVELKEVYINDIGAWCGVYFGNAYANPLSNGGCILQNDNVLYNIVIPDDTQEIKFGTFYNALGVQGVKIGDNVYNVSKSAFAHCEELMFVIIGSNVSSIGEYAFNGCSQLQRVYCTAQEPPQLGSKCFMNIADNCKFFVPENSLDVYKSAQVWSNYADKIYGYSSEPSLPTREMPDLEVSSSYEVLELRMLNWDYPKYNWRGRIRLEATFSEPLDHPEDFSFGFYSEDFGSLAAELDASGTKLSCVWNLDWIWTYNLPTVLYKVYISQKGCDKYYCENYMTLR